MNGPTYSTAFVPAEVLFVSMNLRVLPMALEICAFLC